MSPPQDAVVCVIPEILAVATIGIVALGVAVVNSTSEP